MADVGVRAFKADVSGYLKRAAAGERVRVTSRGKALVELVPAAIDPAGVDASIDRLRESGVVTPARSSARLMPTPRLASRGAGTVADDIVAERDRETPRVTAAALYVDASAATKLFLQGTGSEVASGAIAAADVLIGSRVLYTEVAAAVYRRLEGEQRVEALREWERLWPDFDVVEVDARLAEHALGLAQFHGLGTLDAIHLASALRVPALPLQFATWDAALAAAARAVGLRTLPASG